VVTEWNKPPAYVVEADNELMTFKTVSTPAADEAIKATASTPIIINEH